MNRIHWPAAALALTLPLTACDDAGAGRPGSLTLNLTDAPGDFSEAWVQIDRIEVVGDGGETEEGRIVLSETATVHDLLSLANDLELLVADFVVPAGRYSQLRMVISEACIVVEEEEGSLGIYASSAAFSEGGDDGPRCGTPTGDLQMPSYDSSGLKIGMPGGSVEIDGDSRVLLLDFDVHESFGKLAGNSGMWVMDPNVRAEDISFSASLTVQLSESEGSDLDALGGSLGDFEARIEGEAVPVAFSDDDMDGTWTATFMHLMPETYVVSAVAEGVGYEFTLAPDEPQSVTLGSGDSETVAFVLTAGPASSP